MSVFCAILPYIEQTNLYNTFDQSVPRRNIATTPGVLSGTVVQAFLCPSDAGIGNGLDTFTAATPTQYYGRTNYRANGGLVRFSQPARRMTESSCASAQALVRRHLL